MKTEKVNGKSRVASLKNHRKNKFSMAKNQIFPYHPTVIQSKPADLARVQKWWETVEKQRCEV